MIYINQQDSFGLLSKWSCSYIDYGSWQQWAIDGTPTADSRTVSFPVSLPFDAVIHSAWLTMTLSTALSGSAYQRANGISIPGSGRVDLPVKDFSSDMTSYEVVFSFRANGLVYSDTEQHEGRLSILTPTLHIAYNSISHPGEGDDESMVIIDRALDTGVQLPRLLDANFTEIARIDPDNLRLTINVDPKSMAVMRVPPGEPALKIGDFLELFSPHGSVGIFRVIEIEETFGDNAEALVYMEHAIGTLADSLAIGTQSMSAPVATVFATLLETQNVKHWVLGDCEVPEDTELIYEYSYENLLQAITGLTAELPPEYMWEFDMLRHPFVMHLRRLPEGNACEVRMSRNLASAKMTIDRSELCTRLVPFGAGEGQDRVTLTNLIGSQHIDSVTAETWGLVSRTITASEVYDALTLKSVAERYLERHGEPIVSIVLDAMDLYEATGEKLDYFSVGTLCRVALPDYGATFDERVVSIVWPDVFNQPERVDVTLANRIRDAADEIAELMREATNSKLIGGSVETIEESARAGSITPGSPFVQSFEVTGYGNVLNVRTSYRCVTSSGVEVDCHVAVDGNEIEDATTRTIDITRYLDADENGVPLVGTHKVRLQPATLNTTASEVNNTITIKQIKR